VSSASPDAAQDSLSVEKNKTFFADNRAYAQRVAELTTYRNIRVEVNEAIAGTQRLLDVGNGGVFDYDTQLAREIVGVDLFLDEAAPKAPNNVTLRYGDALALDEPPDSFDGVLFVLVLHHLVSHDVGGTVENIRRAIGEARRVLQPGGKLIIVESCVSARAFAVERRLFGILRKLASSRFMDHSPTLQLPTTVIEGFMREHFDDVRVSAIRVGPIILQFGRRWPTALTPARPYLFVAT
jgi:SAM-dependent methyltransferase